MECACYYHMEVFVHFICLCPTYGRPSLVCNSLALFRMQKLHSGDSAHLVFFEDAGQLDYQLGPAGVSKTYEVRTREQWIPLPRKYNALLDELEGIERDPRVVYVVWDDDDVYLPNHLARIRDALRDDAALWAHPSHVYSTYGTDPLHEAPRIEVAKGRFHGALAVRGELLYELGGWPDTDTATYDQQMLWAVSRYRGANTTPEKLAPSPTYVYRWADTGRWHCSGSIDAGQYRKPPLQEPAMPGELIPHLDQSSRVLINRHLAAARCPAAA